MRNFKLIKLSLFFVLITSFSANTFAEYKLGRDYSKISKPLTVKQDGIVDVMEVFWYGCGACYSIEGPVNGWKKTLPDHVNFTKFPVTWGPIHQTHAALYHTIEALDLTQKAHSAVFVSIHKEKNFLRNEKAITDFLKGFGVAPETASAYLNSFAVKQKVSRGIKISKQLQLGSTPMLIVDGTYIIQPKRTYEEMFKVAEYVIELQKTNS